MSLSGKSRSLSDPDFTYSFLEGPTDRGLRQSVTELNGNKTSYTYDPLGRLERAERRKTARFRGTAVDRAA